MAHPHPFDANWISGQAECAEACLALGAAEHAAALYEQLTPYAGRPATAARAVTSYGAVDRLLGGLAALLGRPEDAVRHLHAAIRRDEEMGCAVWREHARRRLSAIAPDDPLATSTAVAG